MALYLKYNPVSGFLDFVNDGGGGANLIWGYVANYAALPLGITSSDPAIGDLVGVNASQGVWFINYRAKGFYKRVALTGVAATDYGTEPYASFSNAASQATVDAGLNGDEFVSAVTLNAATVITNKQLLSEKDASNGYAGLTLFKINFKNVANTFTSFFTNSNTASRTYTFQDVDDTVVMRTTSDTLTNKRNIPLTVDVAPSATPTINSDVTRVAEIVGLNTNITSMTTNLTGTPQRNELLQINITDNGVARTITWGSAFAASGTLALPTLTVISTKLRVLFQWSAVTSKWEIVAVV